MSVVDVSTNAGSRARKNDLRDRWIAASKTELKRVQGIRGPEMRTVRRVLRTRLLGWEFDSTPSRDVALLLAQDNSGPQGATSTGPKRAGALLRVPE
jgi:hypothetical protein